MHRSPGPLGLEAIARHARYVLERRGPRRGETEAIRAVVLKESRTEPKGQGQASGGEVEGFAGVVRRQVSVLTLFSYRLALAHERHRGGPLAQKVPHLGDILGRKVEGREDQAVLLWGCDAGLVAPEEGNGSVYGAASGVHDAFRR